MLLPPLPAQVTSALGPRGGRRGRLGEQVFVGVSGGGLDPNEVAQDRHGRDAVDMPLVDLEPAQARLAQGGLGPVAGQALVDEVERCVAGSWKFV